MKLSQKISSVYTKLLLVFTLSLFGAAAWAQDGGGLDVDVDLDKGGDWYANPIVWIVGGAVFVLLLVALMRGGNKDA